MPVDLPLLSEPLRTFLAGIGDGRRPMPLAGDCPAREETLQLGALVRDHPLDDLFPGARDDKSALAGLWLYVNALEESHRVSQSIPSVNGSFWHGIMHRREPDPGNAAYWFRRVGQHPAFPGILSEARAVLESFPSVRLPLQERWDPFRFIDFCEEARRQPGSVMEAAAMAIQLAEWRVLFAYCASPADK